MKQLHKKLAVLSVLPFVFGISQAQAHVQFMNFDNGDFVNIISNITTPNVPLPSAVFAGTHKFVEGEFEHAAIAFDDGDPFSHIHGTNGANLSRMSQLEADAGGAFVRRTDGDDFSFQSWWVETLNTSIIGGGDSALHVVGLNNGVEVANITLSSSAQGSTVNLFALDGGFGNVDLVEWYFDPAGRGNNPTNTPALANLEIVVDNLNFNDAIPAIPEPETYAMLLAGLGLVGFAANRRRRYYY